MAYRLRAADEAEIRSASGLDNWRALELSRLESDICLTLLHKGEPACMFGISRDDGPPVAGSVWMLGTDEVTRLRWFVVRHSHEWLSRLARGCDFTYNVVDRRNTLHIRWLSWLGYKGLRLIPSYGVGRKPFIEFVRLEPCVNPPR